MSAGHSGDTNRMDFPSHGTIKCPQMPHIHTRKPCKKPAPYKPRKCWEKPKKDAPKSSAQCIEKKISPCMTGWLFFNSLMNIQPCPSRGCINIYPGNSVPEAEATDVCWAWSMCIWNPKCFVLEMAPRSHMPRCRESIVSLGETYGGERRICKWSDAHCQAPEVWGPFKCSRKWKAVWWELGLLFLLNLQNQGILSTWWGWFCWSSSSWSWMATYPGYIEAIQAMWLI